MTDSPHEEGSAARLQAEADLAAAALDEQYRTRLCRLVEREMSRRFRRKEAPEDVVQSAFRTFYRRNALGEFHRFRRPAPPLELLIAVKRHARRVMSPGAADRSKDIPVPLPAEVHRLVCFASIAAALVRLGRRISKSSPEVLRAAWERLATESYLDEGQRKLFAAARERPSGPGGGKGG